MSQPPHSLYGQSTPLSYQAPLITLPLGSAPMVFSPQEYSPPQDPYESLSRGLRSPSPSIAAAAAPISLFDSAPSYPAPPSMDAPLPVHHSNSPPSSSRSGQYLTRVRNVQQRKLDRQQAYVGATSPPEYPASGLLIDLSDVDSPPLRSSPPRSHHSRSKSDGRILVRNRSADAPSHHDPHFLDQKAPASPVAPLIDFGGLQPSSAQSKLQQEQQLLDFSPSVPAPSRYAPHPYGAHGLMGTPSPVYLHPAPGPYLSHGAFPSPVQSEIPNPLNFLGSAKMMPPLSSPSASSLSPASPAPRQAPSPAPRQAPSPRQLASSPAPPFPTPPAAESTDLVDLFQFNDLALAPLPETPSSLPAFFGGDRSIAAKPIMSASSSSSTLALQQPSSGSPSASPVHSALRLNRIEDAFTLGAELGRGTFGAVRVGISRASGRKSAIKQIQKSSLSTDILHKLELEIVILKRASHPNIVNLEAVFQTQDSVYLVAEVAEGGNLFNRMKAVKTYSELEASALVKNVCCAIEYLHKMNIVHRDIKPENILLVSPTDNIDVKLADFGLSCYFSGAASLLTRVGTPLYVAPEILSNKGYGPAVDMWAVGVLTFCLLSGKPPFPCQDLAVLYQYIMQAKFSFDDPVWLKISTEAKEFIKSLLKVEPSLRLSAPRAFRHPWVQQKHTGLAPGNMNVDQAFGKYIDLLASH